MLEISSNILFEQRLQIEWFSLIVEVKINPINKHKKNNVKKNEIVIYLETRFYTSYGTPGPAGFTLQEEQPGVLLQNCVRRSTCVTGYVFFYVSKTNNFVLKTMIIKRYFLHELICCLK